MFHILTELRPHLPSERSLTAAVMLLFLLENQFVLCMLNRNTNINKLSWAINYRARPDSSHNAFISPVKPVSPDTATLLSLLMHNAPNNSNTVNNPMLKLVENTTDCHCLTAAVMLFSLPENQFHQPDSYTALDAHCSTKY